WPEPLLSQATESGWSELDRSGLKSKVPVASSILSVDEIPDRRGSVTDDARGDSQGDRDGSPSDDQDADLLPEELLLDEDPRLRVVESAFPREAQSLEIRDANGDADPDPPIYRLHDERTVAAQHRGSSVELIGR